MTNAKVDIRASITKSDDERRFFYAWASVVEDSDGVSYIDSQGDIVPIDELQKTAHAFMNKHRVGKVMHEGDPDKVEFVESLVVTADVRRALGMPEGPSGWLLGGYVKDEATWAKVKSGELSALSIGGAGVRKEL